MLKTAIFSLAICLAASGPALAQGDMFGPFEPDWSPDGAIIAIHVLDRPAGEPMRASIQLIDTTTGEAQTVLAGDTFLYAPAFSADGSMLYASGRMQLAAPDPDIFRINLLDGSVTPILSSNGDEMHPALSSDGQWMAYDLSPAGSDNTDIYLFDLQTGESYSMPDADAINYHPSWSADGRTVFADSRSEGGLSGIVAIRHHNEREMRLQVTEGQVSSPDPAPDGQSIVYAFTGSDGIGRIMVSEDGSDHPREIFQAEAGWGVSHPTFSPDGETIAFISPRNDYQTGHVMLIDLDGSDARILYAPTRD